MFIAFLTLIASLYLASIAAWFSIVGIMTIFSGFATSAMYMGVGIEFAKIMGVSWLYRNWKTSPLLLRLPTLACTFMAMVLTSVGIFGYLSKAHLEQNAPSSSIQSELEVLQYKIDREQKKIESNTIVLDQLDQTVNTLIKNEKISSKNGAREVRESQKAEREALNAEIEQARLVIDQLTTDKIAKETTLKGIELEVGPIKYISNAVYGQGGEENLEKAVTLMILMIMITFDPFAIVLLMCANHSFMARVRNDMGRSTNPVVEPLPEPDVYKKEDKKPDAAPVFNKIQYSVSPITYPDVEDVLEETTPVQEQVTTTEEPSEEEDKQAKMSDYVPTVAEPDVKQSRLMSIKEKLRRGEIGWINIDNPKK